MNTQITSTNSQLQQLVKEQNALLVNAGILNNSFLRDLMENHSHLIHDDQLYGKQCHISFKASKTLILDFIKLIKEKEIKIVTSLRGSGMYRYDQIPETYKEELTKKDSKVVFKASSEYLEKLGVKDYRLLFFVNINDHIVKISLDFSHLIHQENYSSLSKGYKIPHLINNSHYTKNGSNGDKYFYRNYTGFVETTNYENVFMKNGDKLLNYLQDVLQNYIKGNL